VIGIEQRSAKLTLAGRRPSNEDSVADVRLPDGRHLIAVADGMGGHQSGEVASAIAIEVLCREVAAGRSLKESLHAANLAIHEAAARDPRQNGMGTTLVALLSNGSTYEVANVGDSRAYRVERKRIAAITRDHSFAAEARQSQLMSPEEIARSPWRNALTRSLGTEASVEVDVFGPYPCTDVPHAVLLCSDGIYRGVSDDMIRKLLLSFDDLAAAAEAISTRAFQGGSDDNMSVAIVEFGIVLAGRGGHAERGVPSQVGSIVTSKAPPSLLSRRRAPSASGAIKVNGAAEAIAPGSPRVRPSASVLPGFVRRLLGVASNDNALFGISVAILLLWLLSHLSARG
jgi:PPM family protein phosphatase